MKLGTDPYKEKTPKAPFSVWNHLKFNVMDMISNQIDCCNLIYYEYMDECILMTNRLCTIIQVSILLVIIFI